MSGQCLDRKRRYRCQRIGRHAWHHHDELDVEWQDGGTWIRYWREASR